RIENGGVGEHRERLVEAADQGLAADQIYRGLAADGGLRPRPQGGRDLQDRDAAHEDRGQKSAHVVDDAAAVSDHHAGAVGAELQHLLGQLFHVYEALLIFAARQVEHVVRNPRQSGRKLRAGVKPDVLGGDHEYLPGLRRNVVRGPPDHAALHDGGIASLRRFDLVSGHTPFYHAALKRRVRWPPAMLAVTDESAFSCHWSRSGRVARGNRTRRSGYGAGGRQGQPSGILLRIRAGWHRRRPQRRRRG